MTSYTDDYFTPEAVDEQIEHLSQNLDSQPPHTQRNSLSQLLIEHLRLLYRSDTPKEDAHSLARSWQRIAQAHPQFRKNRQGIPLPVFPIESRKPMKHELLIDTKHPIWQRRLGLLAAVAFLALLIGSMAFVLNMAHMSGSTTTGSHALATTATSNQKLGKVVYTSPKQMSEISSISWTANSQRIAVTGIQNVEAWDATTGRNIVTYIVTPGNGSQGFVSPYAVAWSPNGKYLAGSNNYLHIWNAQTTKQILQYPAQSGQTSMVGAANGTDTLSYTPNGNHLISLDTLAPMGKTVPLSGGNAILALTWSPDSQYIAIAMDGGYGNIAVVLNAITGKVITTYHGHSNYISSIAWSPDGQRIATTSQDGTVQIWNPLTGTRYLTYNGGGNAVAWSPDGKRIASAGQDVQVWNPITGKTFFTYSSRFFRGVSALAWSPDGTRFALSGTDVEIVNATTGKLVYTFTHNPQAILAMSWSPNGKYIASATGPLETGPVVLQVWIAS